jgi:putative two-component system response regulator
VDVYDAMTTERPHRNRKSHEEAIEFIRNESGVSFDPELVDVFIECEKELSKAGER